MEIQQSSSDGVESLNGLTGDVILSPGTNITLVPTGNTITINAIGDGTGTVTSVSVVTANGFSGSVLNPTTTPAITLTTTVTPTQVLFAGATGVISGDSAMTYAGNGRLTLGVEGSISARLSLADATSGTVDIIAASGGADWTMTLPSSASGGAGNALIDTDGLGTLGWASFLTSAITSINSDSSAAQTLVQSTGVQIVDGGGGAHTFTAWLSTGVNGGQSAFGGTKAGEDLTLVSTTHAVAGEIYFGANKQNYFSEVLERWSLGAGAPTATMHIKAGSTSAGSAPIKLTSGALNTVEEIGAFEYLSSGVSNSNDLYFTIDRGAGSPERKQVAWITSSISGNAATATLATTATTATNVTVSDAGSDTTTWIMLAGTQTGNQGVLTDSGLTYNASTNALTATTFIGALTGNVTGNVTGSSGSTTGNAATATALQNARTIGGVSFDGTANITVSTATGGFTVSGGNLALGANSITMSGSIGVTGTRVTKLWATDIESTNMPTVGGTAILTSLTAPSFTTVELGSGGATDTTLSRVSAGIAAIEGNNIVTENRNTSTSGVASSPTASQTDTITHSLGRTPKVIRIYGIGAFVNNAAATPTPFSMGTYSSSGNTCVYMTSAGTSAQASQTSTVFSVFLATSSGNTISGVIQNVGTTSFDIVWTETGTAAAQKYMWECE